MIAVITGDIVNSRKVEPKEWMPLLKSTLAYYGQEPSDWEIYRGDSFQLILAPKEALKAAFHLKASIKQFKSLDLRLSIGIGQREYDAPKITESNGEAFVNSGAGFENLTKRRTLIIHTPWPAFDQQMNLYIDLTLLTMNNWPASRAQIIKTALEHPDWKQQEIADYLNKTQSTVSESLGKSGYEEILRLEKMYRELITQQ
ncbi:SatD family protein [Reichenbachiella agarivorans]|uniref:SatD family protein n=1 Tax=Reichenbachiella agarivorans TaxID=2979464 RepID=A0ABY6CM90_9BACT|nr:SatD family protein [Reichenbachiella agarivorans]UXP31622.1 SatD family protein [Reichenbachiella agarivorans]